MFVVPLAAAQLACPAPEWWDSRASAVYPCHENYRSIRPDHRFGLLDEASFCYMEGTPCTEAKSMHTCCSAHRGSNQESSDGDRARENPFYRPPDGAYAAGPSGSAPQLTLARVLVNKRMTATDWDQDVRHIELDLGDSGVAYRAGDVAVIHPQNLGVDKFITARGWSPDAVIRLERRSARESVLESIGH